MKALVFIVIFAGTFSLAHTQGSVDSSKTCLEVAKDVAKFWKIDSLANNGFRNEVYKKFLHCKLGTVYADWLINLLGKPNARRHTGSGDYYIYYYFDAKYMPKNYTGPAACLYIVFNFENDKNTLSSIGTGDIDRYD